MLLELHIADLDITSGSAPITWCLDKELLQKVKTYKDPHIVISVVPEDTRFDHKENRYVVPLKDMMSYVSFRMPGKNKIYAYLTETKPTDIMEKHCGRFTTNIVASDGGYATFIVGRTYTDEVSEEYTDECGDSRTRWVDKEIVVPESPHAAPLEVDVPKEYFAKEPAAWEKSWVLWMLKDKGIDQCAFRKRRLFAYTVQPVLMVLSLLVRVVFTLLSLIFGLRGFSLKFLLHPLTYDLSDVQSSEHSGGILDGGSIFVRPEPEKFKNGPNSFLELLEYVVVRFWSLPFMPAILVPLSLMIYHHKIMILLGIVVGVAAILFIILMGISGAFGALFGLLADSFTKITLLGGENEIDDLICTGDPTRKPKRRSIKLRYLALKSKVCKPFAG